MLVIAFGTRPEWIKIKPVVDVINGLIPFKLLYTGQHKDLIDNSIDNYDVINVTYSYVDCDNRLNSLVCTILEDIEFPKDTSYVMVQGDTTSAFAVALAAFHNQIPVIHLEAGLRTYDIKNPYPEEFNRAAITALAHIHLCPTETAASNIAKSRQIECGRIFVTGNTVLDNLVGLEPEVQNHVLVTMHRRENHKDMHRWFDAIDNVAKESSYEKFYLPLHPNPEVSKHKNRLQYVEVIDPLDYKSCIDKIRTAKYIITDSGGIQEEASFLKKKCIVCRKVSERTEGIYDFAWLCHDPKDLKNKVNLLKADGEFIVNKPCPYGDGKAAIKIKNILMRRFFS